MANNSPTRTNKRGRRHGVKEKCDSPPGEPTFIQQCNDDPAEIEKLPEDVNRIGDSIYVQGSTRAVTVTPTGEKVVMEAGDNLAITLQDAVFCSKLPRGNSDVKTEDWIPKSKKKIKPLYWNKKFKESSIKSSRSEESNTGSEELLSDRMTHMEHFKKYRDKARPVLPGDLVPSWALTKREYTDESTQTDAEIQPWSEFSALQTSSTSPELLAHFQTPFEDSNEQPNSWCSAVFRAIFSILIMIITIFAVISACREYEILEYLRSWIPEEKKPKSKMEILWQLFRSLLQRCCNIL